MEDKDCLVVDFFQNDTKLFVNGNEVDINQLFDEKDIATTDRKMLIKITSGLGFLYDGYEVVMLEPFDLTTNIEKLENSDEIVVFKNVRRDEVFREILIETKINKVYYDDAVLLYKNLENKEKFSNYCDVLCKVFYNTNFRRKKENL